MAGELSAGLAGNLYSRVPGKLITLRCLTWSMLLPEPTRGGACVWWVPEKAAGHRALEKPPALQLLGTKAAECATEAGPGETCRSLTKEYMGTRNRKPLPTLLSLWTLYWKGAPKPRGKEKYLKVPDTHLWSRQGRANLDLRGSTLIPGIAIIGSCTSWNSSLWRLQSSVLIYYTTVCFC